MVDGQKIPDVNDGVMNDPERQLPKDGTTGTEGGVSQKDKDRKAQEGQTGERLEKKPDPPKEAPPLPHSEQELIKTGNEKVDKDTKKPKAKEADPDDDYELAGLEVCLGLECLSKARANLYRNPMSYQRNRWIYHIQSPTLPTRTTWISQSLPNLASLTWMPRGLKVSSSPSIHTSSLLL